MVNTVLVQKDGTGFDNYPKESSLGQVLEVGPRWQCSKLKHVEKWKHLVETILLRSSPKKGM